MLLQQQVQNAKPVTTQLLNGGSFYNLWLSQNLVFNIENSLRYRYEILFRRGLVGQPPWWHSPLRIVLLVHRKKNNTDRLGGKLKLITIIQIKYHCLMHCVQLHIWVYGTIFVIISNWMYNNFTICEIHRINVDKASTQGLKDDI